MNTYKMTIKYPEDILDYDWGFEAESQEGADSLAFDWNRYHGRSNSPGYGWAIAVETDQPVIIKNEWARR